MNQSEAVEEAATALGLGYLTPDQRKVMFKLWDRGRSFGWSEGYAEAEFDEGDW